MLRLCICLLFLSHPNLSFSGHENIIKAVTIGDWKTIANKCSNRTEIVLSGKDALYTKDEANQLLRNFFQVHRPDKCNVLQNNTSPKGASVIIFKYFSGNNIYKITVYIDADTKNGDGVLQTVRIEALIK